jgi:hypothetical protein
VLVAERRSVSRASIEDGTVVMTLAQIVAMGTLPNVSTSATPFADASLLFMEAAGALLIGADSVIAMTGKNMGTVLTGSRVLFALAENGELVLPSYTWATITIKRDYLHGDIGTGARIIGIVRHLGRRERNRAARDLHQRQHSGDPIASPDVRWRGRPALFVVPMGTLGPVLAIAVSLLMLAGATFRQLFGGALALIIGAVLFVANKRVAASKISTAHRDD